MTSIKLFLIKTKILFTTDKIIILNKLTFEVKKNNK